MIVFLIASFANAGLEVVFMPDYASNTCEISLIGSDIFGVPISFDTTYSDTILDFSNVFFPADFDLPGKTQRVTNQYGEVTISNIFSSPKSGVIMTGLIYDYSGATYFEDFIVTFHPGTSGGVSGEEYLSDIFHVLPCIPEPLTFVLLGFGGLYLRRRIR